MPVSPEDTKAAQVEQDKYWQLLKDRMEFFLDENTKIDLSEIFALPSVIGPYVEHALCERALADGYPIFARYWASRYLSNHIDYVWLQDYQSHRLRGVGEKAANAIADKQRKEYRETLLKTFP